MPFVWRRNGVYQFRGRLSKRLTELGAPASLSLSLQTQVLVEAMKRAAAIVAALERVETEVTTSPVRTFTPAAVTLIVREAARAALAEIVERDAPATKRRVVEADAIRASLELEIERLKTAMRLRDGEVARPRERAELGRKLKLGEAAFSRSQTSAQPWRCRASPPIARALPPDSRCLAQNRLRPRRPVGREIDLGRLVDEQEVRNRTLILRREEM